MTTYSGEQKRPLVKCVHKNLLMNIVRGSDCKPPLVYKKVVAVADKCLGAGKVASLVAKSQGNIYVGVFSQQKKTDL